MRQKLATLTVLSLCLLPAWAQKAYELGKPGDANYRYLDDYRPLKEYINYEKYPNFKLGVGTTVDDYLRAGSLVNGLTNDNFTETVAGNAMKMASCVRSDGSMDFTRVKNYVKTATEAGLNIYGHTLAWHSQQANGWLRSLIKDKPAQDVDGDVTVWQSIASKDFTKDQSVGWKSDENEYSYKITFDATNGMKVTNTKEQTNYLVQYVAMGEMPAEKGEEYKVTMVLKGSKAGSLTAKLSDWGSGAQANFAFTTSWSEVSHQFTPTVSNPFLLLQSGSFVGDIYIKSIKVEKQVKAKTVTEERRCIVVEATEKVADAWDNQFWIVPGSFSQGDNYEFTAEIRADQAATATTQIHTAPGTYVHYEALGNINFTTFWKTIKLSGKLSRAGSSIAFNLNELAAANKYYFDNLSFKVNGVERLKNGDLEGTETSSFYAKVNRGAPVEVSITDKISYLYLPAPIPLTQAEKLVILSDAMELWIKGMMDACEGKVKAWDVVNEAISGGGDDGDGNYTLQHAAGYVPGEATWDVGGDAFYWQDHMGDLDYVRTAIRLARKHGPEDIKLFINDYNLESDWDDNKKLKSLIGWIKKWEADGVTKVDGIGTQMHISCYMNAGTQKSKEDHIVKMFQLMAQSGKLVRVSELDMGMCDASGKAIATTNMTEDMHKRMAKFYQFIVEKYLEIIPAEQQWGICQWCPTDAPGALGTGWRGGEPVGFWDQSFYRKHAYAGIAEGLGSIPNAIDAVEADRQAPSDAIYDIHGNRMNGSLKDLPAGIYVAGGNKIIK